MQNEPITLAVIEQRAAATAEARKDLVAAIEELQAQIDVIKRRVAPSIRAALAAYNTQRSALTAAIEQSPSLFERPRTYVFHGLKCGMQKGKGGFRIEDEARCIQLIRRHLPDQSELLIRTVESVVKDALGQVPAGDLKRIGVHVVDATDQVVCKPIDGEIEKLIKALTGDPMLTEETQSCST